MPGQRGVTARYILWVAGANIINFVIALALAASLWGILIVFVCNRVDIQTISYQFKINTDAK